MGLHFLDKKLWFPPVNEANETGLLAIGGDLRIERLLLAYRNGIFPWFEKDEPPLWYFPDPRFVLFPDEIKISKSMKQTLRKSSFDFRMNTSFEKVIEKCSRIFRKGQNGTWINPEIIDAYTKLHYLGMAHCAEAWQDEKLAGGLYGVRMGKVFFGESMFSEVSNASKFAFINYVSVLRSEGVSLIDCQVYTPHLESLGARLISARKFSEMLRKLT